MKTPVRCSLLLPVVLFLVTGCGRKPTHDHDHESPAHQHEHVAPHGGTAVVLGDEAFHLEFVRDAESGSLTAYVLDAHLENFIRLPAPDFAVVATVNGAPYPLTLGAVGSPATGETVGDTAQFTVQADWLKTTAEFDAVIPAITVRGVTFPNVRFNFPRGNETN